MFSRFCNEPSVVQLGRLKLCPNKTAMLPSNRMRELVGLKETWPEAMVNWD